MSYILMRDKKEYLDFSDFDGTPIVSSTFHEFETKRQAKDVQSAFNSLLALNNKKPFELYSLTKEEVKKTKKDNHEATIEE